MKKFSFSFNLQILLLNLLFHSFLLQDTQVSIKYVYFNETNFEQNVNSYDNVLIYFTANWSTDSQSKKQNFLNIKDGLLDIKKSLENRDRFIVVGEVNSKSYKICHDLNIKKYPSIVLISGKTHFLYKGEIEPEQILNWLRNYLIKKTVKFDNFESLNATKERENVLVMFYGDPSSNPSEYELFFNMTDKFQYLHFYYFSNSSIIPHLNLGEEISSPSIVILKNFDEEINAYTGNITHYDVYEFIRIFSRPVVSNLNPDSYLYIINERISFISLMIPENHPKIEEIKELYYDLSLKFRNKLMSFIGNYEELKGTTFTYEFNVKSSDLPIILIEEFTPENTIRRYKSIPSDFESNATITSFFTRYYEGNLKKYLKSERLPNNQQLKVNNVYQLVGENFENIVMKENEFVFVMFTRRNCGLCNEVIYIFIQFEKNFLRLAEDLEMSLGLSFARIDGSENEFESIEIKGFPTFILFPKGSDKYKNLIMFEEVPNYISLKNFIRIQV